MTRVRTGRGNRRLGLVLSAVAVLGGCGQAATSDYATAVVAKGDVRDVVPAVGSVKALSQIEVRADAAGRVIAVFVAANARVRQGEVLARVKPDRLALDVEAARAEQTSAEAAVAEARARAEQTRRNLANRRSLSEKGFISPAALGEAESNAQAAEAMVARARADASRAAVRVRAADGVLDDVLIRAPSDGFVLSRHVEPGQVVTTGSEEPLFVIASHVDKVLVEAQVAEPDISRITPDARIFFTVEAYPQQRFTGRLRDVLRSPIRDRNFVSYPVLIEADNPDGKLFPGMTASVEFIHADSRNVLRIPVEALYFKPDDYVPRLPADLQRKLARLGLDNPIAADGAEMGRLFATGRQRGFVMIRGKPEMRAIRIGAESPDFVEVTEGLRAGDVIVTGRTPGGAGPSRR